MRSSTAKIQRPWPEGVGNVVVGELVAEVHSERSPIARWVNRKLLSNRVGP